MGTSLNHFVAPLQLTAFETKQCESREPPGYFTLLEPVPPLYVGPLTHVERYSTFDNGDPCMFGRHIELVRGSGRPRSSFEEFNGLAKPDVGILPNLRRE
jgi:hypothetical protein